ncbi:hypothetical protein [Hyphomicrobium sp.]|uniref:hypothetical protein n=1 Tax=Hyphomicrobium sp. TaxID=82 RepID=UPI0025C496C7|nr:hypothetical protein [Hyphomicrobium sp.]MCC7252847.1 hypothetical protein [Hyphomicrobium sp.]
MLLSKKVLLSGIAAAALAAPAFAEDRSTEKQKEQYLYQQGQENNLGGANSNDAIGATKPNSGPGVQGPADTRTGPATKAPGGSAEAGKDAGAASGASSGEAGMSDDGTQPSQDSSGVQGFPDTRTGPATRSPDGTDGPAQ